jgi:cell division protein FtsI/penicillin-binding protein 2
MMRVRLRACAVGAAWWCVGIAAAFADDVDGPHASLQLRAAEEAAPTPRGLPQIEPLRSLKLAHRDGDAWVATDTVGRRIEYTIDPGLQEKAQKLFKQYQLPYAAAVAIEPSTGRLLAYASHSSANPNAGDLARDPSPPTASVFKLITSSALIETGGATPASKVCYCGGSSRIDAIHLRDDPRREHSCATLAEALGSSINAVFAKMADRHLDPSTLLRFAHSFGFGQSLGFSFAPPPSPIDVPSDRLEFARTAAGFWHAYMSPLHGALIAATIANDGTMPKPMMVQRVIGPDGEQLAGPLRGEPLRRVISPATAHTIGKMMLRTVRNGTSRSAFLDSRGRPVLHDIAVAAKTGSLSANDPYRAYSWWVGFAPADKPRIALAALVVNTELWRIKSSFVARELLREYLLTKPPAPKSVLARRTH